MMRSGRTTSLSPAALGSCACSIAALAALSAWPEHFALHLVLYVVAGLAWILVALERKAPPTWLIGVALCTHVVALAMPPRHSDDYHRYLWDGSVQRAGIDPYRYAPEDPALAFLRDDAFTHLNNRQLPTIYPPGAQLAFRLAASLHVPPLVGWKLLVALGDLLTALLLYRNGRRARRRGAAFAWLACPLVIVEVCVNGHVEALALLPLFGALLLLRTRPRLAGFLLGVAGAIKLMPLYLFALLRDRRVILGGVLAVALAFAPYVRAGSHVVGSLGEYGRRWRGNDGVFAVVLATSSALVARKLPTAGSRIELGDWAPLITGRDRPQIYADELAGLIARTIVFIVFVVVLVVADRAYRAEPLERRAIAFARIGVGALLLLTPALHPWYGLWLLPPLLIEEGPRPVARVAWLWLIALVPLGHVPLVGYLHGQPWHDPLWTRLLEHVPTLALLAWFCRPAGRRVLLTAR